MKKVPANPVRIEVMGEEFVEKAMAATDATSQPLQDFINEHAWGSVWEREGLTRKERSLITVAVLTTLRATSQLRGHVRGALNNGLSQEEIVEAILHCAIYAGMPAAGEATKVAQEVFNALAEN